MSKPTQHSEKPGEKKTAAGQGKRGWRRTHRNISRYDTATRYEDGCFP